MIPVYQGLLWEFNVDISEVSRIVPGSLCYISICFVKYSEVTRSSIAYNYRYAMQGNGIVYILN